MLCPLPEFKYRVNRYKVESKVGHILITDTLIYLKEILYMSTEELNNSPEFFPFEYNITINVLDESNTFLIDKFGGELVVSK